MMKMALSPAAASLLRALLARAGIDRNRILLTEILSTPWHSLTFAGERHRIDLRVPGPGAAVAARLLTHDLGERSLRSPVRSSPTSLSRARCSSIRTAPSA